MIRFKKLDIDRLEAWLEEKTVPASASANYCLRLWHADHDNFDAIEEELREYIEEAHDDARKNLRQGFEDELSPFDEDAIDPAENYPAIFHNKTLKGYLGETLAGILVEHLGAHNRTDWNIPAYLFRFHLSELQHLEEINQKIRDGETVDPSSPSHARPGRTGDDFMAFVRNNQGKITHVLVMESKCVKPHHSGILNSAHTQVSKTRTPPTDTLRLMEILRNYDTDVARKWHISLAKYYQSGYLQSERYNGVSYTCSNSPATSGVLSWMPHVNPNPHYTALALKLEGLEVHMPDVEDIIDRLYGEDDDATE